MRVTLLTLAFFLTPGLVLAQVDMPATVKAKPGALTQIVVKNVAAKMAWSFVPADGIEVFREHEPDVKVIKLRFVAEAGTYYLIVSSANGDVKQQVCVVTVGGTGPAPKPDPPPVDPPSKLVKHLSFVGANQATAGVVNDVALREYLASVGVKAHVVPAGEIPVKMLPYVQTAGGVPALVLQDELGHVVAVDRISSVEATRALVKRFLGK